MFPWLVALYLLGASMAQSAVPTLPPASNSSRRGLEIPAASRPAPSPTSRAAPEPGPRPPALATESRPALRAESSGSAALDTILLEDIPAAASLRDVMKLRAPNETLVSRAVEEVLRDPSRTEEILRAVLKTSNGPLLVVAGRAVARNAQRSLAEDVVAALRRAPPADAVPALVDALVALDSDETIERLFELAEHRNGTVRSRAALALESLVDVRQEIRLSTLLSSRRSETRQFAARLLGRLDTRSSFDRLTQLCGDASPTVAYAAAEALARHGLDGGGSALTDLALSSAIDRSFGYLCIALSLREGGRGEPLSVRLVEPALTGVEQPDPFVASASALVLGSLAYHSQSASTSAYLESKVVPALVVAASGDRYFPDFSSVHTLAIQKLVLLTGRDFGENGPAWSNWWRENHRTFRANRQVFELPDEPMLTTLAVDVNLGGTRFTLRGDQAEPGPWVSMQEDYLLAPDELAALAAVVRDSDLLGTARDRAPQPTAARAPSPGPAALGFSFSGVTLRDRLQRKSVADRPESQWSARESFARFCRHLRQANLWQRYRDPSGNRTLEEFLASERAFLAAHRDAPSRARHLCMLIAAALPALGRDRCESAYLDVVDTPSIAESLDEVLTVQLLSRFSELDPSSDVADRFCALLGPIMSERIEASLVQAVEKQPRARAIELLQRAWSKCDVAVARRQAASRQGWVRASAAERLARSADPDDVSLVIAMLRDGSEEAVLAAVRALGANRIARAVPELAAIEGTAPPTVRRAVAAALGAIGGPEVYEPLWRAAHSDDVQLQRIALTSMGESGDVRTVEYLVNFWIRSIIVPAGHNLGSTARAAALRIGGDRTRDALRKQLDNTNPSVRNEVAIALAELSDAAAVPVLIDSLETTRDPRVKNALVSLTCQDLFASSSAAKAYRTWWGEKRGEKPAQWFADACVRENPTLSLDPDLLARGKSLAAVPGLVQILTQSNEWYLRVNALRYLEVVTGRSFGPLDAGASSEDRRRIAAAYVKLYEGER